MAEDTDRYPLATRGVPTARTYGDHDPALPLALTWHTTETGSWPGYRMGLVAPHHTYKAVTREWRWHGAPVDQRVGTMRSSFRTRTPANEKAYQVEIVAYSNRTIADRAPGRIWVGDFTEDHYRDLAAFATWLATVTDIDMAHVTPTPPGGWRTGSASPPRLARDDWLDFDGMTAHGAVTGQVRRWDTGVLDLARISDYANDLAGPPPPPTLDEDMKIWLTALQRQTPEYFVALAALTGSPGGNDPGYWGRSHNKAGDRIHVIPSDDEWDDALEELAAASVEVGVQPGLKGDDGVDGVDGRAGTDGRDPISATFTYD